MNNNNLVESPSVLDLPFREVSDNIRTALLNDKQVMKAKRKVSKQVMLDSLFDSDTGNSHEASSELMDMINNEYQVDMVEVSSGNGLSRNVWNYEKDGYEVYLSADGRESNEHSQQGLSNSLVDSYEGIASKNEASIPAYNMADIDGELTRIDNMACMVTVDDSDYSIWDTIAEKGALIVRHSGHWKGAGCRFDKERYAKREALRATKKHNRLMGYTVEHSGANTQPKDIKVMQLNKDKKGNKHLTKLAKQARHGQQWARDELTKIGYNEFTQ